MNVPLELHADILIGNEHLAVWELLARGGQLRIRWDETMTHVLHAQNKLCYLNKYFKS